MLLRSDGRGSRAACVSVAEPNPNIVHWWNRRGVGCCCNWSHQHHPHSPHGHSPHTHSPHRHAPHTHSPHTHSPAAGGSGGSGDSNTIVIVAIIAGAVVLIAVMIIAFLIVKFSSKAVAPPTTTETELGDAQTRQPSLGQPPPSQAQVTPEQVAPVVTPVVTPVATPVTVAAVSIPEAGPSTGSSKKKFCPGCGNPVPPGIKFCATCGGNVAHLSA